MTNKQEQHVLHLEALPKGVKRALRGVDGLDVVECRPSNNAAEEHGKTTLIYTTKLDAAAHNAALHDLSKNANVEQDLLLRDDEEDA